MKKIIKRTLTAFTAVCLTVTAAGCGLFDKVNDIIIGEAGITNDGGSSGEVTNCISIGILGFDTFNPLLTKSETVKECMQFVYEPMFSLDEQLEPVPVLADSYTVSDDGKTIEITFKQGILWQDGTGFTAYDAAYTIKQIRAGITPYTDALANMTDYMATGDYTLRINLGYAVPNFVSLLTFPIVKYKSDMTENPNYIPIGTGPFKYEAQVSTGKLSFAAYDGYRNGRPELDNIYVYTAPSLEKYESMFEANEIDIITGETVDLSEYTPRGTAKNNEYITNKMTYIGYNCSRKLLSGKETRIGLSKLIDKDSIVNSTIYSRGVACDVPINPASIYYYDTNTKFKKDETLALQHLGDDGWGIDKNGKYVRTVNGERQVMGFEILANSDSTEQVNIAKKITNDLNDFGIPTELKSVPTDEYNAKTAANDFDIVIGETEIPQNLDLTGLVSSSGNIFSYYNPELDDILNRMGMTRDSEEMKELFKQYGNTIVSDMPFTVLFFRKGNIISGSKIKSEVVPSIGRLYNNVETWSVKE